MKVLSELNIDTNQMKAYAENYQKLCVIASLPSISEDTRNEATRLISQLPPELRETWTQRIKSIKSDKPERPQEDVSTPKQQEHSTKSQFTVTVTNTDKKDNVISSNNFTISRSESRYIKTGTYVTIQCPDGVKLISGSGVPVKNGMKVEVKSDDINFVIGGKIRLTIKPKKNAFETV